jgi:hypothetical protein
MPSLSIQTVVAFLLIALLVAAAITWLVVLSRRARAARRASRGQGHRNIIDLRTP